MDKKRFLGEIELDSLEKINAIMGNNSGTKHNVVFKTCCYIFKGITNLFLH